MKLWVFLVLLSIFAAIGGVLFYAFNDSPGGNWGGAYKSNGKVVTVIFNSRSTLAFTVATPYSPVTGSTSKYSALRIKSKRSNGQLLVYKTDEIKQEYGELYATAKIVGYQRLELIFQKSPPENGPKRVILQRLTASG